MPGPLALSDEALLAAAAKVPVELRPRFLEQLAAELQTGQDVGDLAFAIATRIAGRSSVPPTLLSVADEVID
jgi:hypothetical protein